MSLYIEHRGQGRDLVLLHGWGMQRGVWDDLVPALASRFHVHAVDLPGHGKSSAPPRSFDDGVDRLAQAIPNQSLVCGWSLGGLLAQGLASRHPQSVSKLLLVSTTACFRRRPGWDGAMAEEAIAEFAAGLREDRTATLARFVRLNALGGARGREAIRSLTQRLAEHAPPKLAALETTLGWLHDIDLRPEVPAIKAPTVVLHGTRDRLTPIAAGRWLATTIARARLIEIDDAAHLPFFTHPHEFIRAIYAFE